MQKILEVDRLNITGTLFKCHEPSSKIMMYYIPGSLGSPRQDVKQDNMLQYPFNEELSFTYNPRVWIKMNI